MISCSGKKPSSIGIKDNRLTRCPKSPNCVVSFNDDKEHYIEPIIYDEDRNTIKEKLLQIISNSQRTKIIKNEDNYIYVEYTSKVIKFVDDVEFLFTDDNIIHVRSASRVGHTDFGVNKARIENIKSLLAK